MKNIKTKTVRWISLVLIIVSLLFVSFKPSKDFELVKNLDIFFNVFRELTMFYVDDTDSEKLIETAINKMLESLDPYTTYIPPKEIQNFKFMTTGEYGGIGAMIRRSGDYTIITEPYKGFPADKANLKAGDMILEIDDVSLKGKDLTDISEMLKGTPNTSLKIKVVKAIKNDTLTLNLTRQKISIKCIPYYGLIDSTAGIGYIYLDRFTDNSGKEVEQALKELKSKYKIKSLIFDLRGNPGGLLDESIKVANVFVKNGQLIVSTKGKLQNSNTIYKTSGEPIDTVLPMVVMVNHNSASASEIIAGSLQDLDRAVIIGERTYGKGLVQSTRPISYDAQLKITTAKYYIPSGRCIQAIDYSHRNPDGSVGHIPDSLVKEFKTRKGRKVYDGGGVNPDITIESEEMSKISTALYIQNIIFDFATNYVYEHPSINTLERFELTDADYANFVNYIKDKDFDYKTDSEKELEELIKIAKEEKYYAISEKTFNELKKNLAHDKIKDLETFKKEIKELLREEIITRYYYEAGRVQASIQNDPQIEKALSVLKDSVKYRSILDGNNK